MHLGLIVDENFKCAVRCTHCIKHLIKNNVLEKRRHDVP